MTPKYMIGREPGKLLVDAGVPPTNCRNVTINLPMKDVVSIDCNILLRADQWPVIMRLVGPSQVREFHLEGGRLSRLWQALTGRLRIGCRLLPTRVPAADEPPAT